MSKKSVAFAVGGADAEEASAQVRRLLQLPSDQERLDALKLVWASQTQDYLDTVVRECAKELAAKANDYVSHTAAPSNSPRSHAGNRQLSSHSIARAILLFRSSLRRAHPSPSRLRPPSATFWL